MRIIIFILLANLTFWSYSNGQAKPKTILAIFPHSDDETVAGVIFSKYAQQNKVYVLYVADDADTSGLDLTPEGDSINHKKIAETKCACEKLGVEPVFLGLGRLDARRGPRAYFLKIKALKAILTQKIKELDPDAIITYGPDGESGHYEHQIVSSITTEIILNNGWVDRYPLYYPGWPKEEKPIEQLEGTGEVDTKYLTVAVHFSEADEARALESYKCFKNRAIQEWKDEMEADKSNIFYFRQFAVTAKQKKDLFDK